MQGMQSVSACLPPREDWFKTGLVTQKEGGEEKRGVSPLVDVAAAADDLTDAFIDLLGAARLPAVPSPNEWGMQNPLPTSRNRLASRWCPASRLSFSHTLTSHAWGSQGSSHCSSQHPHSSSGHWQSSSQTPESGPSGQQSPSRRSGQQSQSGPCSGQLPEVKMRVVTESSALLFFFSFTVRVCSKHQGSKEGEANQTTHHRNSHHHNHSHRGSHLPFRAALGSGFFACPLLSKIAQTDSKTILELPDSRLTNPTGACPRVESDCQRDRRWILQYDS